MADRYWIGGAGDWNSTAHWAASSGGSGGQTVPTSSDDVFVDANCGFSGANQFIDMNVSGNCRDFNFTFSNASQGGGLRTFTNSSLTFSIFGNLNFADGPTAGSGLTRWFSGPNVGTIAFASTATGKTVTLSGNLLRGTPTFSGSGGGWTLQDTFTATNQIITVTAGTFSTNGKTVTGSAFSMSGGTISLGATTMTLAGTTNAVNITGGTVTGGTSTIVLNGSGADFKGGGKTFNNVTLNGTTTMTGANTFNTLALNPGITVNWPVAIQTISTLSSVGTSGSNITYTTTGGGGANRATLTVTTANVDYVKVINNNSTSPIYNEHGTDNGNNVNWFFTAEPEAQAAFLFNFV